MICEYCREELVIKTVLIDLDENKHPYELELICCKKCRKVVDLTLDGYKNDIDVDL